MSVREVGHVVAWDGEAGTITPVMHAAGQSRRLAFTAADVIEGVPAIGNRCTFTPVPGSAAVDVRAKADS